ncbi:MAG: EthD family reductase [Vulcanimicrobiaceae bacterium]
MAAHVLALYNTPADIAHFEAYYHGTHVPLAKRLPGLRSYTLSKGAIGTPAGAAPYYLIADLAFDSMDAIQAALGSPEGQAVVADVPNFATGGVSLMMYETANV